MGTEQEAVKAGDGTGASGSKARKGVPLVRTAGPNSDGEGLTPERMATDPRLLRTDETPRTRRAEDALALGTCLYFYAGHACPQFGDIVFVYDPSMSATWPGYATPFDTGGIIGYIHVDGLPETTPEPSKLSEATRKQLCAYVRDHRRPLGEWQDDFDAFIKTYYDHSADYVRGKRPKSNDPTGRHHHRANTDRRAWTWEVQKHLDHDIFDGLWLLCLRPDRYNELRNVVRSPKGAALRPLWLELFRKEDVVPKLRDEQVWDEAERRIAKWL